MNKLDIQELKNVHIPKVFDDVVIVELPTSLCDAIPAHGKGKEEYIFAKKMEY
jgi:hypothetical protein